MNALIRCLMFAALLTVPAAFAQAPDAAEQAAAADVQKPSTEPLPDARKAGDKPYRYPLPAIAQTVRDIQHSTQAMLLMEYCADRQISDEFVSQRLAEFSRQTGRQEDCRTLLEY